MVGMAVAISEASVLRFSGESCAERMLILSSCAETSRSFGSAARAEASSVMPASVLRKVPMEELT